MNREELKAVIPHREPMLLIDECILIDKSTSNAKYLVRGDEFFLQGHFPNNPVVPGVILCEMMAQGSCLIFEEDVADSTPYYTSMNNVKFKRKVVPGDLIEIECTCVRIKKPFYFVKSTVKVGNELAACGELSFALIKK